jgi:uncharacterized protein YqhQ
MVKRVYSGIGGQAVIEGIMMKSGTDYAVGVRTPSGKISVTKKEYLSMSDKYAICRVPFIRGIFAFVDSLVLGMGALEISASFFSDEEDEEEPTGFEKWLIDKLGDNLEKVLMTISMVVAVILAVGIFVLLPMFLSNLIRKVVDNYYLIAILEGFVRIAIFVAYIKLISNLEDIKRTFMYHGAEHKCINCVELGLPMTVDNVMKSSKEHKRCGTSFLIIVMMISILFFMVVRVDGLFMRAVSRIVCIPIIAGISYEFLRIAGRSESPLINALSRPGMWMQALTTTEPTPDMCEVAIAATEAVFDWRAFLRENFGWEPEDEHLS